jgi:hydrophobe/amphiphile efflux-3 (HAE3) family protein
VRKIIFRLVDIVQRHAWPVLAATALITVVMGFFAARIQANPDMANLIPKDSRVNRLLEKYGVGGNDTDYLIVMTEAPDLFRLENLALLDRAYRRIEKVPTVSPGITPFNFISFSKEGARLAVGPMAPGRAAPSTPEALSEFKKKISTDPVARNTVISADGTSLCAIFPVELQTDYGPVLSAVNEILRPLKAKMDVRIGGMLPYSLAVSSHLYSDLPVFLLVALFIILVSYYLSFRTLRAVVLPILVVVLGAVWSTGFMSILGFKLTIFNAMIPPLVLILGSSYSLHVLNQYYREAKVSGEGGFWLADAVQRVNMTIFLASATTIFGFGSLLTASLRQLREFGVATSIGILFCALLALFFLPAALSLLAPPNASQRDRVLKGAITHGMGRLGLFIVRRRTVFLVAAAAIAVLFSLGVRHIRYETNYMSYLRKSETAVRDNRRVIEKFGGFVSVNFSIDAPGRKPGYFLDPGVLRGISRFEDRLSADKDIPAFSSFTSYLRRMNDVMTGSDEVPAARPLMLLLSRYFTALSSTPAGASLTGTLMNGDYSRYTIQMRVYDSQDKSFAFEEHLKQILSRVQVAAGETLPAGLKGEFWGPTISILYLSDVLKKDQFTAILTSALLVFLISALVFRSGKLGLIVLAPVACGIMLDFILMWLFAIPLDVVTITFTSVAIGIGVDNAMHFTLWYRRQRTIFPLDPERAIEHTMKIAGRPMFLTTMATTAGLLVFLFSAFSPVVYFGILISISLLTTTASSLVLLPVLLYYAARREIRKGAGLPERVIAAGG